MNISNIVVKILKWFLDSCKKNKVNLPIKWKIIIMLLIGAISAGKFLWFLSKVLDNINIEIDKENKTWKISSKYSIDNPAFQKRYYDDIDSIMKPHPELYKEWRHSNTNLVIDTNPNSTEFK